MNSITPVWDKFGKFRSLMISEKKTINPVMATGDSRINFITQLLPAENDTI